MSDLPEIPGWTEQVTAMLTPELRKLLADLYYELEKASTETARPLPRLEALLREPSIFEGRSD